MLPLLWSHGLPLLQWTSVHVHIPEDDSFQIHHMLLAGVANRIDRASIAVFVEHTQVPYYPFKCRLHSRPVVDSRRTELTG